MGLLRRIVRANYIVSDKIEAAFPLPCNADGNRQFVDDILPRTMVSGSTIWDVGGGSRPYVTPDVRRALSLRVIGLDISAEELAAAPAGSYDEVVVHDICTYEGRGEADFVICKALLEHTPDTVGAVRALASIVRSGGEVLVFAPSRNALYAKLNTWLPEAWKRRALYTIFPNKAHGHDGFPAYYDQCVPNEIESLARAYSLEVEERYLYWASGYFKVFVPAYLFWRAYQRIQRAVVGDQAAETFAYVFRKA